MDNTTDSPLFIASEALCYYPISTIYNSCPRYLFYALLIASCVTRWTGWLADVFLGAAATYAGTAAIQTFIMVSSSQKPQDPGPVSIPWIPANSNLLKEFPSLVTESDHVLVAPASYELDADAVMAIVVTGYLVFLPLQFYAARTPKIPIQYMFCYPDIPPFSETSNDGWQPSWRTSSWNSSVWHTFSNISQWGQLGDICFNPCFNTTQILRQSTSLHSVTATDDTEAPTSHGFWKAVLYSKRYIYSLIILCLILNCLLLTYRFLPYRSRIPSAQIVVIWKDRKSIWNSFKEEIKAAMKSLPISTTDPQEELASTTRRKSPLTPLRPIFTRRFLRAFLHTLVDAIILFGIIFSMIVSPFTIVAFVAWIEFQIYNDGPSQESPRQVGQWAYLVSIALLVISAGILTLKYKIASVTELENEIEETKKHLEYLEKRKGGRSTADTFEMRGLRDQFKGSHHGPSWNETTIT
ncbi:unnamed protein product [Penicillium bialowiezense]